MRFYMFVIVITGILLLFNTAGYQTPITGSIISVLNMPTVQDAENNTILQSGNESLSYVKTGILWGEGSLDSSALLWILGIAVASAITIGVLGGTLEVAWVLAPLVILLGGLLISDLVYLSTLFLKFGGWMASAGIIIFGILIVGLIITLVEWWRGIA